MQNVYQVEVKDRGYTYHARYGKTSASATQGPEFAARRVISKYTGININNLKASLKSGITYLVKEILNNEKTT